MVKKMVGVGQFSINSVSPTPIGYSSFYKVHSRGVGLNGKY